MATTMDGLFGASPYEVEQQQYQKVQDAARQFAQMSPFEKAGMLMYQGGSGLGRMGAEALGGVNVPVQQAQQNQQAMQGADLQTPEGLRELAKRLLAMGNQRGAYLAAQKAQEIESSKAAAELATRKQDEAEQFRRDQLTETMAVKKMQLEQAAEAARLRSEDTRYSADQRAQAAREATAARLQLGQLMAQIQQMRIEARASSGDSVAQQRLDWQKEQADEKAKAKSDALAAKEVRAKALMAEGAKNVIGVARDAKKLVGMNTAGFGSILANLPATDARTLQSKLKTITANLGFDRLQQMRDASPTGGALGAVAVKELEALQSTVASLDQGLEGEELLKSLDAIEGHYNKWVEAVRQSNVQEQSANAVPPKPTNPAPKGITPAEFNARWATLPRGQSLTGPDGKTYTKK